MKKAYLTIVIAIIVLVTTVVWILNSDFGFELEEIIMFGGILILIVFALFVSISRFKSLIKGQPAEDELSKRLLQKASSISFYISLYMWLALSYFSDKIKMENHTLIGGGILGMAIIFASCWLVFKIKGIKSV
ncbi:hypothetical protein ACFL6I_20210 [candidate division KSB1 bacterium]